MNGHCGCWCHKVAMVFHVLAGLAAALFFVAAFRATGLWGWGVGGYFESAIMLMILGFATKSCGCYCHHGCGCEVEMEEEDTKEEKMAM